MHIPYTVLNASIIILTEAFYLFPILLLVCLPARLSLRPLFSLLKFFQIREEPVISGALDRPIRVSMVGATSQRAAGRSLGIRKCCTLCF